MTPHHTPGLRDLLGRLGDIAVTLEAAELPGGNNVRDAASALERLAQDEHNAHQLAHQLRDIIERMHKHVGDRLFELRQEAEALLPLPPERDTDARA